MYDKTKVDTMFNHHFIRKILLQEWLKHGKHRSEERPMWIAPEEVIQSKSRNKEEMIDIYKDLIKFESNQIILKTKEELEHKCNWWPYIQIKDLFNSDKKKYGFREQKQIYKLSC